MKESETKTFVAEIIPIVKGIPRESLSYFTQSEPEIGSFVRIPIRNKEYFGLVTHAADARTNKSELKNADFSLKKLSRKSADLALSPAFVRAARLSANYVAAPLGSVLAALIPRMLLESPKLISSRESKSETAPEHTREPFVVQLSDTERMREYQSLIRESFARKRSVLFVVPTHEDGLRAYHTLSKGIEEYSFVTSGKSPKALVETLRLAHKEPHPILFITTPLFMAFDRPDLETIVLERENARAYRPLVRPFLHPRVFLEYLAHESGRTLIMGDSVLSLETLHKEKQGDYAELSPLKWRVTRSLRTSLVDMKAPKEKDEAARSTFEVLAPALITLIQKAHSEKRKIFLFGARKGLAPSTSCRDCGSLLACENCGAPLVLHTKPSGDRIYFCHACGAKRDAGTRCDTCNSWNLEPLGIGTDRIKAEVERLFPDIHLCMIDKDHTPTPAKARIAAKKFAEQKGGIMIGTELAFLYLERVPYSAVVSLDSLFSIPDFSMNERIFSLITRLLEMTESEALIQTRNIGKKILEFAADGNILDFYRSEVLERRELSYPPFSVFIKVETEGTEREIEKKAAYLGRVFQEDGPDFMLARGMRSGRRRLSMILRLARSAWPDASIRERLLLLPPEFSIKVDPESLLSS